jgi:hypothetical protein
MATTDNGIQGELPYESDARQSPCSAASDTAAEKGSSGVPARYSTSIMNPRDVWQDPAFCQEWEQVAAASKNLYALYQSPTWWDYALHSTMQVDYTLRLQDGTRTVLAGIRDGKGRLEGVVGAYAYLFGLSFSYRAKELVRLKMPTIRILGGQPLIRDDESLYVELVRSLFKAYPDLDFLHLQFIPVDSFCWHILHESKELRRCARVCLSWEPAPHPQVTLPENFEQYLGKFKSKTRWNWKRRIRQLREHGAGHLELIRIEHAADVKAFLEEATTISRQSWQWENLGQQMDDSDGECRRYMQFADRGILRSYLLRCRNAPCAYVRGFQYGNVFYYSRVGFDESFAAFSPGTVLLYLMIEDLCACRRPERLNFQEGYWDYKRLFATECPAKQDFVLIRRGARPANQLLMGAHRSYRGLIELLKGRGARRGPTAPEGEPDVEAGPSPPSATES